MSKHLSTLDQIVNPSKFQQIQEDISLATGLAIITVDYMGIPITAHSNCSEFCKILRSKEKYRSLCEKCDSRGGLEAARIRKPFIYFCHAGLVDFAIPIIVDNLYLGAFMAGQVLLDSENQEDVLEHILSKKSNTIDITDSPEMQESYSKLPVMSLEKVVALANMLMHIGNYCIDEAILRASIKEMSTKLQTAESHKASQNNTARRHNNSNKSEESRSKRSSEILRPALNYINQNPHEKITLNKLATLCNISASYFSKLFAKENLGNLSDYVNKIKISRAKELLQSTDMPIRNIADNLGFGDSGYFIKVFKQETSVTPSEYRNHNTNQDLG